MNPLLRKLMGNVLRDQAGDGTGGGAGGGTGAGADEAAAAAKAKADADAAAKAKADADAAAGDNKGDKKPSDEEAKLLKEVMDKKKKLDNVTLELTQVKEQLKQFEGIDAGAIRKLLAEQANAETAQLEAKGEWDRLKQRMGEEHAKQVGELNVTIEALKGQVGKSSSTINDLTVGQMFNSSKLITEELTLTPSKARLIYSDHFDVTDGKVVGYDKPRGSENRTAIVDSMGNPLGFDDVMKKIVEADPERDYLFKSKMKPGAGSDSVKSTGKQQGKQEELSGLDKIASGLKGLKPAG